MLQLQLLDWTGRQIALGKIDAIPAETHPILKRLWIEPADWLTPMTQFGRLYARIAGRRAAAANERF
jgi:hypothetical protein